MWEVLVAVIIISIIVIIFIIIILFNILRTRKDKDTKVMYETCSNDCGDGLTCDVDVCKRPVGQGCSTDEDCEGSSQCVNWVCTNDTHKENIKINHTFTKQSRKRVRWNL